MIGAATVLLVILCLVVLLVLRHPATAASVPELTGLRVVSDTPDLPGYDRDCGPGDGCVFGPAWSDDVDVAGGHNGCDTRNDVLRRDLTETTLKPGTHDCVVLTGVLIDPYDGARIDFVRGSDPQPVQIDHVFPLAAAWDRGAADWTPERRRDFANDPAELLATAATVNQHKSDHTPADWRPPTAAGGCRYARAFARIARSYDLAVTTDDVTALTDLLRACPVS